MGIGNDIKPKKVYQYNQKNSTPIYQSSKSDEDSVKVENDLSDQADEYNEKEELENDFFENKKTAKKNYDQAPKASQHNFSFGKTFIFFSLIVLCAVLVFQNFDLIKGYISGEKTKSNQTDSSTDKYYEGEKTNDSTATDTSTTTEDISATSETTAATTTAIDKSTIKIKLLNGNGIKGSAAEVKTTLTSAGFTVGYTGNAQKFTYTTTIVYYKTGKDAEANLVKDTLSGKTSSIENSDSIVGSYDIVIVVGKT